MDSVIKSLVEVTKKIYTNKDERNRMLSLLNDFFSKYYGLYFLKNLLTMKKTCQPVRLHGGWNTISLFSPEILFVSVKEIISDVTLPEAMRVFIIRALFATDMDYMIAPDSDKLICQQNLDDVVRILNRDVETISNQFELFAGYFTTYYFQKNCNEYVEYQSFNLNNELFRLAYKCNDLTYNILDIHSSDQHEKFYGHQNLNEEPLNVFIEDLIIILAELQDDPSQKRSDNAKKRIFRANFFLSLIFNGYLNFYEYDFTKVNPENITSVSCLWNKTAKKYYDGPYMYIDEFQKLHFSDLPIVIKPENLSRESILSKVPVRHPYQTKAYITSGDLNKTLTYFQNIANNENIPGTATEYGEIKNIIRRYTGNYYHSLNSCLFNYFYDYQKCNPDLLNYCRLLNIFIIEFSSKNKDIFSKSSLFKSPVLKSRQPHQLRAPNTDTTPTIKLYRTENNVSLGLVGSYYFALPGNKFISTTFWSTSYNRVINLGGKKILLEISIEQIDLPFLIIEPLSSFQSESEVLLPFGCVFEIMEKSLISVNSVDYTLIKIKYVSHITEDNMLLSMNDYYRKFNLYNYAQLPKEKPFPPIKGESVLNCHRILAAPESKFKGLYNAYYSRTLPIIFNFKDDDYILKFYLFRREINGIKFPNKSIIHPLQIELNVYDLTQKVLDLKYVTPNLLQRFNKGVCNLGVVKQIVDEKNLCLHSDSWACQKGQDGEIYYIKDAENDFQEAIQEDPINIETFLSKSPWQLLEMADFTGETLFQQHQNMSQFNIFNYIWQIFYTINVMNQRYNLVHFDLKPGNIFIKEGAFRNLYVVHGVVIEIEDRYMVKIGDYDASFIDDGDNILISRDSYHMENILPYTLKDKDKLDVKLFFKLHDQFARDFPTEVRKDYLILRDLSKNRTVNQFLIELIGFKNQRISIGGGSVLGTGEDLQTGGKSIEPQILNETVLANILRTKTVSAIYSNQFNHKYGTYFPIIDNFHYNLRSIGSRHSNPTTLSDQAKFRQDKLRICTYNVHEFKDVNGNKTNKEIWDLMDQIDPDILVLQEAVINSTTTTTATSSYSRSESVVKEIMSRLNFNTFVQCKADYTLYNFVYIKKTIDHVETLFSGKIGADDRCGIILLCTIEKYNYQFIIVATHFSVRNLEMQMDNWLTLVNEFAKVIKKRNINLDQVGVYLVGDFNSYRKPDDIDEGLKLITDKTNYWLSSEPQLTELDAFDRLFGLYDSVQSYGFIDTYDLYDEQQGIKSVKPIDTSIHGGKIDHIMVKRPFHKAILGLYQIYVKWSDHTPLVCDILL